MAEEVWRDDSVMREKIQAYRDSLQGEKPELDIALLFKILDTVNDASEVHVAIDPIGEDGNWSSDAETWACAGVKRLDDGRVVLRVHDEHHGISADDLYLKLKREFKRESGKGVPVLYIRNGEVTQLTDAYSHALVKEMWAGMPFDLVLAVREEASA